MANEADQNTAFLESTYCQCLKRAKLFLTTRPLITCPLYLEWSFFDAFFPLTSIHSSCLKFCSLRQALLISSHKSNQNKILLLSFLGISFCVKTLSQFICIIVFFTASSTRLSAPWGHRLYSFCLLFYLPHLWLSWFTIGFSSICVGLVRSDSIKIYFHFTSAYRKFALIFNSDNVFR